MRIVALILLFAVGIAVVFIVSQYLTHRRDARLNELKETQKELLIHKRAINVARSSLQKVGNQYSHNPPLEALQALDEINAILTPELKD